MPHLVIDYADSLAPSLDMDAIMDDLHAAAMQSGLFKETDIKVRAESWRHWRLAGNQAPLAHKHGFVNLHCHQLEGRSDDDKSRLADILMEALKPQCEAAREVSVEIVEITRATYRKHKA